jgi:hypothetical protein
MADPNALASVLVDHAIAELAVPVACPCDFGPGGRYRLEELIGIGRSSHVYRATDRHLSGGGFESTVAVKISTRGDGLRRDALSARRVAHPNVLSVLDQGIDEYGQAYVVAEYLGRGDLSSVPVPLPAREAAEMIIKLARAVHAMHSAGVVHCDLKPSNILMTDTGEPKLADFDLACWELGGESERRGNLAFMSPEQFHGEEHALTPPTDIYALGGLLYYLLTGRLPHGATPDEVAACHASERPPAPPGAGRDLDAITLRAMARRREDRYHSAAELADDLQRWLDNRPLYWTEPSMVRRLCLWVRRRPVAASLVAASVIAVVSAGSALGLHLQREARTQREANRRASEMVEQIKERLKFHIRLYASQLRWDNPRNLEQEILPKLVWLSYISDFPVLREDGLPPALPERVQLLGTLVETLDACGRGAHLSSLLARYALAYTLIDLGESEDPLRYLAQIRERWGDVVPADDQIWEGVGVLEECARANAVVKPEEQAAVVARLADLERRLVRDNSLNELIWLTTRTRERLAGTRPRPSS